MSIAGIPLDGRTFMKWFATLLCMLIGIGSIASAQTKDRHANDPISVVMEPIQFPPRTGTFYPVSCKITNRTPGLWEGSLRIRQLEDLPTDFEFLIPDLVVGTTPLEFLVTLPPIRPNMRNQQTELTAHAIDKDGKITELPNVQLISHTFNVRTLVFGVCTADGVQGIPGDLEPLIGPMQLFDNGSLQTQDGRTTRTALPSVVARDLSENPLDYIRFDGLLISQPALEQFRPRQLSALEAWIKAGGTAAVNLPTVLDSEHLELLNRLVDESPVTFRSDPERGLICEPPLTEPMILPRGLGQIALIPAEYLRQNAENRENLDRLSRDLWRTRSNFQQLIEAFETHQERLDLQLEQAQLARMGKSQLTPAELAELSRQNFVNLDNLFFEMLKPRNMGVIPVKFLVLALIIYVLVIGPGDYYFLGRLKARRFTWIVFPLVTLCFSWGMLRITNYVMGSNDQIRTLRIVDLDSRGEVLRENEISLLMFSNPKRENIDAAGAYTVRLETSSSSINTPGWDSRRWQTQRPAYVGRIPGKYSVRIDAEQWTPEKYRTSRVGGTTRFPNFPWDKYAGPALLENHHMSSTLRAEFQKDLQSAFGGTSVIAALYDGSAPRPLITYEKIPRELMEHHDPLCKLLMTSSHTSSSWLRRVSPQCADSYDDLALLEVGDTRHWALGIFLQEGENLLLYRVLMNKAPSTPQSADTQSE